MKLHILCPTFALFQYCLGAFDTDILKNNLQKIRSSLNLQPELSKIRYNTDKVERVQKRKGKLIKRRVARTNLKDLSKVVSSAPVIEGVRMSDDESDIVMHRNGKFINNFFVGEEENVPIPPEYTVTAVVGEKPRASIRSVGRIKLHRAGRSHFSDKYQENNSFQARRLPFEFKFTDFYAGRNQDMRDAMAMESKQEEVYALPDDWLDEQAESRSSSEPVYFIAEDPDSLHADRSPYTFEPADAYSFNHRQPAVISASNEDFVIKEHTYQMCPGCPSFSIPIPVPKSSASSSEVINPYNSDPGYEYQHQEEETIMERIMAVIQPAIDTAKETVQDLFKTDIESNEITQKGFSDRLSSFEVSAKNDASPLMYAGMAVMGLGVATLLSSGLQIMSMGSVGVGRQFDSMGALASENSADNDALEYDVNNILCIPRNYCENLKRKKYMIDQYPTAKKVASVVAGMVFDKDFVQEKGEASVINQCHLRECIFSLIK